MQAGFWFALVWLWQCQVKTLHYMPIQLTNISHITTNEMVILTSYHTRSVAIQQHCLATRGQSVNVKMKGHSSHLDPLGSSSNCCYCCNLIVQVGWGTELSLKLLCYQHLQTQSLQCGSSSTCLLNWHFADFTITAWRYISHRHQAINLLLLCFCLWQTPCILDTNCHSGCTIYVSLSKFDHKAQPISSKGHLTQLTGHSLRPNVSGSFCFI